MKLITAVSHCFLLSLVGFTVAQDISNTTTCADVHLIVVRASGERPGYGVMGTLAGMLLDSVNGSTSEWIDYPAVLSPYDTSSYAGLEATTKQLTSHIDACSKGRVVLLGYSQGAHVIGDVMCGGGLAPGLGPATKPVAAKYQDRVVALIQMGDPRHMPNKSFNVGSAMNEGYFPRPANISCDPLGSKIQSYCDNGDPYCDRGNDPPVHRTYMDRYAQASFDFVMSRLK